MSLSRLATILFLLSINFMTVIPDGHARKVKQKLKIEKAKKGETSSSSIRSTNKKSGSSSPESEAAGFEGIMTDAGEECMIGNDDGMQLYFHPDSISFAGYDKSISATREDFLIVNDSPFLLTGIKIKITYLDMKGRMLHSRTLSKKVYVPRKETRKVDIPTWDRQKSYFYYLGNEPRKVATPYQVKITPILYWLSF